MNLHIKYTITIFLSEFLTHSYLTYSYFHGVKNLHFMIEHVFQCPYCWENISMLLDSSIKETTYIEDCEVCCRPIQIQAVFDVSNLINFSADNIDQ